VGSAVFAGALSLLVVAFLARAFRAASGEPDSGRLPAAEQFAYGSSPSTPGQATQDFSPHHQRVIAVIQMIGGVLLALYGLHAIWRDFADVFTSLHSPGHDLPWLLGWLLVADLFALLLGALMIVAGLMIRLGTASVVVGGCALVTFGYLLYLAGTAMFYFGELVETINNGNGGCEGTSCVRIGGLLPGFIGMSVGGLVGLAGIAAIMRTRSRAGTSA
jgi:hypothetical protein